MFIIHCLLACCVTACYAAPSNSRRDTDKATPSITNLLANVDLAKLNPIIQNLNTTQLGDLVEGLDFSRLAPVVQDLNATQLGALVHAIDLPKVASLLKDADLGQIGAAVKTVNFAKISPLLGFVNASRITDLAGVLRSVGLDLSSFSSLLAPILNGLGDANVGGLLQGVDISKLGAVLHGLNATTIGSLLKTIDFSKISASSVQGLDLDKVVAAVQVADMSKIGPIVQSIDPSIVGGLSSQLDLSQLSPLLGDLQINQLSSLVKGFDLTKLGSLLQNVDLDNLTKAFSGSSGLAALVSPSLIRTYATMFSADQEQQHALSIEDISPIVRKNAKRVKIVYGPYHVRGASFSKDHLGNAESMDPSGTAYSYRMASDFPRNITLLDVKTGIYTSPTSRTPIDPSTGLYDHHNVFFEIGGSTPAFTSCGSAKKIGLSLMTALYAMPVAVLIGGAAESAGLPLTSADGSFNSGYYLGANANISNVLDIVNTDLDDKEVYVISEMEYLPGRIADAKQASMQVLDVGMCNGADSGMFVKPPTDVKKWSLEGANITITKDGHILRMKAHMHDGGSGVRAYLNDQQICESQALYGGTGQSKVGYIGRASTLNRVTGHGDDGISGTTICDTVVPIKVGDVLRFVADFDVEAHPEREQEGMEGMKMGMAEGMALMTATFAMDQAAGLS